MVTSRFGVPGEQSQQRDSATTVTQSVPQQGSETPAEARSIISNSMSPFCPGLTLQACPSPSADSLRHVIIARVRKGDSRDAIMKDLYADFGEAIRAAPPTVGLGLVAWVMPAIVIVIAGLVLTFWLRSRRRRTGALPSPWLDPMAPREPVAKPPGFDDPDHERLEKLLRRDQ